MNLQEFAALKAGDKISNLMSASQGEVVEVTDFGISVRWHPATPPYVYSVNSTAWMHWDKVEDTHALTVAEVADIRRGGPHDEGKVEADSLDKALDDFTNHPPASIMGKP